MKNKIIKICYIFLATITILAFIYLILKPIKKALSINLYDEKTESQLEIYHRIVKQNIFVDTDNVFRIMFFINEEKKYDNLNIKLLSESNDEIFNIFVDEYNSYAMFFEFNYLEKNKNYTLVIEDLDNDDIELYTTDKYKNNYLLDNDDKNLQILEYYQKNNYMYFWYPLFLTVILFMFYPFVWGNDKNEKN